MFHIVLYEPEIPPNTGNIIRLSANVGATLHLIGPYGFEVDDRRLRRAGLDYDALTRLVEHTDYAAFLRAVAPARVFACSTRGRIRYDSVRYGAGDALVFGPETRGLPRAMLDSFDPDTVLYLPMAPGNRSLNLSNAVSVVVFEAWRQHGFAGAAAR